MVVASQETNGSLEGLLETIEALPVEQKAIIIQRLLQGSGLSVGLNNHLVSGNVTQINLMDPGSVAVALDAIADCIRNRNST